MSRIAFCGGAYQATNLSADSQTCKNMYCEKDESGAGKSELVLLDREGKAVFCTLGGPSVPGVIEINGRAFAVSGKFFYEVFKDGTSNQISASLSQNQYPPSLAASAVQVMIASGGQGYCFDLRTSAFTGPIANIAGVQHVGYGDGFFAAVVNQAVGQPKIFISAALDGTSWDPGTVSLVSVYPGNVVAMKIDHRELCLLGNRQSVCYYDSGNVFPYDVIPGGFMEVGCAAPFGVSKLDNTYFFIGQDERGARMAWRVNGYNPARISTHAIEAHWATFSVVSDAVAFAYIVNGHTFWQINFPTANESWVYDVSTGLWHQRSYFKNGVESMDRACCHMYVFDKHLVGDPLSGNLYEMKPATKVNNAWTFTDDPGQPIRRERISPYVTSELQYMGFNAFELEAETGLGDNPSGGVPSGVLSLSIADPNGSIWSLTVSDAGNLQTTLTALAVGQTVILLDSLLGNTAWQIGVEHATGRLTTTAVPFGAYPFSVQMGSTPGNLQTELFISNGLLVTAAPLPVPRAPFGSLTWSNDRGKTWSQERQISFGRLGEYGKRLIQRMLGRCWGTSGRLWKFVYADNVPLRITDAHIEGTPDNQPTPRIAAKLRAGA